MAEVEICINTDSKQSVSESVGAAYSGAASRIELCSAMHLDGLTPEKEHIIEARRAFRDRKGLLVMIRPRAGDFIYSSEEINTMQSQILIAHSTGADGIVLGLLNNKNDIDIEAVHQLISTCKSYGLSVTFHRAFDAIYNKYDAVESLIKLGINRILTSGTSWGSDTKAIDGIQNLKNLISLADNRIEIVIGGGINNSNIKQILQSLESENKRISIHSYSGVQKDGNILLSKVSNLVSSVSEY